MQHRTCGPLLLVSSRREEVSQADFIASGRVAEILAGRGGGRRSSRSRLVLVKDGEESRKAEGEMGNDDSGRGSVA